MPLPDPETRFAPEGHYKFQISKEPEQRRRQGDKGEFIAVDFFFKLKDDEGNVFTVRDSMVPWEPRYTDLARALGAPVEDGRPRMSKIVDFVGKTFEADIIHEADKKDPSKSWPRVTNIVVPDSSNTDEIPPPSEESEEDDVPF